MAELDEAVGSRVCVLSRAGVWRMLSREEAEDGTYRPPTSQGAQIVPGAECSWSSGPQWRDSDDRGTGGGGPRRPIGQVGGFGL